MQKRIQSATSIVDYIDIKNYIDDGFEKLCDVVELYDMWYYKNINESLMYSNHNSWVYFITYYYPRLDRTIIFKVGETGLSLGKRTGNRTVLSYHRDFGSQPKVGTRSRIGRYRKNGGTDLRIRELLSKRVKQGHVSIYVRKCDIKRKTMKIGGVDKILETTYHKDIELKYLDHIKKNFGNFPEGNKCRK